MISWCVPLYAGDFVQCGSRFEVVQRHFHKIDHPDLPGVFFYTGDISSPFRPFDLLLVSGKTYPPFPKDKGRLKEKDFEELITNNAAFNVTPLHISKSKDSLKFTFQGSVYTVSYTVKLAWFADDKIEVQVCK